MAVVDDTAEFDDVEDDVAVVLVHSIPHVIGQSSWICVSPQRNWSDLQSSSSSTPKQLGTDGFPVGIAVGAIEGCVVGTFVGVIVGLSVGA